MQENAEIMAKCPICHRDILEGEKLYACADRDCGFKVAKHVLGAEITVEDVTKLALGEQTEVKTMTSKSGNPFSASLKLKPSFTELEFVFDSGKADDKKVGVCPKCGKEVVSTEGKYGKYFKCTGCDFKIGTIAGKTLTDTQVKQLLLDKETKIIKGFISKKGSNFDAKLVINENNEITFKFD